MALTKEEAEKAIESYLNYVVRNKKTITAAHIDLGIPLDDLLCCAAKKLFSEKKVKVLRWEER